MPAKETVTKEKILQAAAELLREEGIAAVNARGVARRLNCSTQPIYRVFGDMDGLKKELKAFAERAYAARVDALLAGGGCKPYEAYGLGYVQFARAEKHLFRFLYSGERQGRTDIEDVHLPRIIATIGAEYGYDEATARALHTHMAVYSYGLAFLVNTGYAMLDDAEIAAHLQTEFRALTGVYGLPPRPNATGGG